MPVKILSHTTPNQITIISCLDYCNSFLNWHPSYFTSLCPFSTYWLRCSFQTFNSIIFFLCLKASSDCSVYSEYNLRSYMYWSMATCIYSSPINVSRLQSFSSHNNFLLTPQIYCIALGKKKLFPWLLPSPLAYFSPMA